uniref:Swi3 domain-containing protein n=1 Tax=Parastrongyloides trichosuri TaxID=131310 RepID=A0A0N4ZN65_PARTI
MDDNNQFLDEISENEQPINPDLEAIESNNEDDEKRLAKAKKIAKSLKENGRKKRRIFNELDLVSDYGYPRLFAMVKDIKLPNKNEEPLSTKEFRNKIMNIQDKMIMWATEIQPNMLLSDFFDKCQVLNKKRIVSDCIRGLIMKYYPDRNFESKILNDDIFNAIIGIEMKDEYTEKDDFDQKLKSSDIFFENYIEGGEFDF